MEEQKSGQAKKGQAESGHQKPDLPAYDYNMLSSAQQGEIARMLMRDNLKAVNEKCREAVLHDCIYSRYVKRAFDIIIAGTALTVTLPLNAAVGLITYLDVGSPIFFVQERVGRNGKTFRMIKFRNMTNDRDERGELLPPEMRVTRWGSFVRKTSIDELLNFWSVLKGDMSVIGPRPLPLNYKDRFNKYHRGRHLVRPGLECPSRTSNQALTWEERFDNDVWYVEHVSFATDLFMLLQLTRKVFDRRDSGRRAFGGDEGSFMGYGPDGHVIAGRKIPLKYYEELFGKDAKKEMSDGGKQ